MKSNTRTEFDVDDILNQEAIYTLFGEIDTNSVESAIRFILAHNHVNKKVKFITLVVNSEGGDLNDAFALIDVMCHSKVPVYTLGLGQISSCGLMIFMAGAPGHRVLTPNTHVMSHQWSGHFEGKLHELVSAQEDLRLTTARMMAHYEKYTHLSEDQIRKNLLPECDVYLTAEQAVSLGIADRIQS